MARDCQRAREQAFEALCGELTTEERGRHEAHLAECSDCRIHWQRVEEILTLTKQRTEVELSNEAENRVLRNLAPAISRTEQAAWRRFGWILATTTVAAVCLAVLWLPSQSPVDVGEAVVLARQGDVSVGDEQGLHRGETRVSVGSRLRISKQSHLHLKIQQDHLLVSSNSDVGLRRLTAEETVLDLERGTLAMSVDTAAERTVDVRAPFGTVRVVGTRFSVSTDDGGRVDTWHGVVEVTPSGSRDVVAVRAGQSFSAVSGEVFGLPSSSIDPLPSRLSGPFTTTGRTGAVMISGRPVGTQVWLDGELVGLSPLFVQWPVGTIHYRVVFGEHVESGALTVRENHVARVVHEFAGQEPPTKARHQSRSKKRSKQQRGGEALSDAPLAQALGRGDCEAGLGRALKLDSPALRADAKSRVAECYLQRNDTLKALEVYRQIRQQHRRTAAGQTALFEIGRLSEELGESTKAERAFAAYVKEYGRSPLAGDARFRLCSYALRAERHQEASRCLRDYRTHHARGERMAETLFLEATLHRDVTKDLEQAAQLFAQYGRLGQGDRLEDAAFWRAWCLRELESPDLEMAVRDYLKRFPGGSRAAKVKQWLSP
ncbi:FecR domain-containing protein [Myxococcota bacterium]